jgi:NitT/TauT family transport system permease protein
MTMTNPHSQSRQDATKEISSLTARIARSRICSFAVQFSILAVLLGVWETSSRAGWLPAFWFSSPSAIGGVLLGWVHDGSLWTHLGATLLAMVIGYIIGCAVGISTGFALGMMPFVQKLVAPVLAALYALPKIALAPLFVITLGIGIESKIALVAITVFFLLLYSTLDGVKDVDKDLVQTLRQMGASHLEIITKLYMPATLRWVYSGMRLAVRYALTATVLGEVIASNRGVGYLIEANAGQFNATGVFAAVLVLMVFSILLMELLTRLEDSRKQRNAV